MNNKASFIFYSALSVITLILIITALLTDGTGGSGDSVYHYFYSRYAWQNPAFFFNHWAKPFFTLLASPFAQFGFKGIKIFNVLLACAACWMAWLTAKVFVQSHAQWIFILLFGAPLYFTVTLSGLTEPLSAFMLIASIYLYLSDHKKSGLLLISFLPFVRSEGLILIGVFFVYLLVKKQYRYIPWLAAGHLIFSLAGYYYYHDLLWVITNIPYAKMSSVYGVGNWTHFIDQLYFCLGPGIYILVLIGGFSMLYEIIKQEKRSDYFLEKLLLVYGSFVAFIFAHTCFWALGIFNSMGLTRVLVTVFPLAAIIALDGLNFIIKLFPLKYHSRVLFFFLGITCIFPLLDNPASFDFKNSVSLNESQLLVKDKIVPYLQQKFPEHRYISEVSVALFTERNPFDTTVFKSIHQMDFVNMKNSDVFVWDNWFARVDGAIEREKVTGPAFLQTDSVFTAYDHRGQLIEFIVITKR